MSLVKVEVGAAGNVVRIFRHEKDAARLAWDAGRVESREKASAVAEIRRQVLKRANYECERCGAPIDWLTFEMHEKVFKSKGGEVSLKNCQALCHNCHQGDQDSAHGNRRTRFGSQLLAVSRWHLANCQVLTAKCFIWRLHA